jgi:hypothetical protein
MLHKFPKHTDKYWKEWAKPIMARNIDKKTLIRFWNE